MDTTAATTVAATSVIQLALVDASRTTAAANGAPGSPARSLQTTVHLPATSPPAPLVVLAHGAGGAPERFSELATAWARAGYVVAVPRFPLSNESIDPPVLDIEEQGGDVSFVIDELLAANAASGNEVSGRIDGDRVGLFGLSLGSLSVWRAVFRTGAVDTRVDALIQSDGFGLYDAGRATEIAFPVMILHSDVDPIFGYDGTRAQFDVLAGPKFLLTLHGAVHATVAEDTVTAADGALRDATTVFWDRYLGGRPDEPFPPTVEIPGVTTFEVVLASKS